MPNRKANSLRENILNFINHMIDKKGRSPSYQEIQKQFNLASSSHVDHHLKMMEKDGLITIIPKEDYGIRPIRKKRGIPVKSRIAAGKPLAISERVSEWLNWIPELEGENIYALKVEGHSMIEDGIFDGDYVIIKEQKTCKHGEVIVAVHVTAESVEATLKRFKLVKEGVRLQPSNKDVKPFFISNKEWEEEWRIQGIVVAVFRRY